MHVIIFGSMEYISHDAKREGGIRCRWDEIWQEIFHDQGCSEHTVLRVWIGLSRSCYTTLQMCALSKIFFLGEDKEKPRNTCDHFFELPIESMKKYISMRQLASTFKYVYFILFNIFHYISLLSIHKR